MTRWKVERNQSYPGLGNIPCLPTLNPIINYRRYFKTSIISIISGLSSWVWLEVDGLCVVHAILLKTFAEKEFSQIPPGDQPEPPLMTPTFSSTRAAWVLVALTRFKKASKRLRPGALANSDTNEYRFRPEPESLNPKPTILLQDLS